MNMGKNNFQKVLFAFGAILFIYAFYYTVILFFHFDLGDVIDTLSTKDPNEIGDTVGGILNPLFAISICIFTGLAFYAQYEANKQVQEQFKSQRLRETIQESINQKNSFINNFSFKDSYNNQTYIGIGAIKEKILPQIDKSLNSAIVTFINKELESNPDQFIDSGAMIDFVESNVLNVLINEPEKRSENIKTFRHIIRNSSMLLFTSTSNEEFNINKIGLYSGIISNELNSKQIGPFVYSYSLILRYILEMLDETEDYRLKEFLYYSMSQEEQTLIIYIILGTFTIDQNSFSLIVSFMQEMIKKNHYYNEYLTFNPLTENILKDIELVMAFKEKKNKKNDSSTV
jgi:hypothetical protein